MLMTLEEMKSHLGVESNEYDNFITEQINIVSEAMELYCGRKFLRATYTQDFYRDEFSQDIVREIYLYHYPIQNVQSATEGVTSFTDYRLIPKSGMVRKKEGFFRDSDVISIQYVAGYNDLPYTLKSVLYALVGQAYSKKQAGVDVNFGLDVQRVSIPGTISIDYDYTLQNNDSTTALGAILGNQINVLDQFKSERKIIGTLREGYVYQ